MARTYEIGYGKPPRRTQFKKGRSGNPKGRPKGARNLKSDLEDELAERILVREGQAERRITKQRAMLKSLFARALRGDVKATRVVVDLTCRLLGVDDVIEPDRPLPEEDRAILERHRQRILSESGVTSSVARRRRDRSRNPVTPSDEE